MTAASKIRKAHEDHFAVDAACPGCGRTDSIFGYYFLTPEGKHQHTHYVCTSWPHPGERCGWHGWKVPSVGSYDTSEAPPFPIERTGEGGGYAMEVAVGSVVQRYEAPTERTLKKVASEISDLQFWLIGVIVAIGILAFVVNDGFEKVHADEQQRNKIECVKLRESADSLGKVDREACPYDMGEGS